MVSTLVIALDSNHFHSHIKRMQVILNEYLLKLNNVKLPQIVWTIQDLTASCCWLDEQQCQMCSIHEVFDVWHYALGLNCHFKNMSIFGVETMACKVEIFYYSNVWANVYAVNNLLIQFRNIMRFHNSIEKFSIRKWVLCCI